jgi:hypothetical protein
MLHRSIAFLGLLALGVTAAQAPARAAIGNGMEAIIVEPWLPVVAEAPHPAPRQCRLAPRQVRVTDAAGKPRLRTVQRTTCRA